MSFKEDYASKVPEQKVLFSAHETLGAASEIAARIQELSNMLFGAGPAEACGAELRPRRSGVLGELQDHAGRVLDELHVADDQLLRIMEAL